MTPIHILLLAAAVILSGAAAALAGPGFMWQRAMSLALLALSASMFPW